MLNGKLFAIGTMTYWEWENYWNFFTSTFPLTTLCDTERGCENEL